MTSPVSRRMALSMRRVAGYVRSCATRYATAETIPIQIALTESIKKYVQALIAGDDFGIGGRHPSADPRSHSIE